MEMKTLKYKVMGQGIWITATVSRIAAEKLAQEYQSYGWPTQVCTIDEAGEKASKAA